MKKITFLLFLLSFSSINSQEISEKKIKTEVDEVTVFIEGAQITRKKNVQLKSGVSILNFTDLSPYIEGKSIQVKANGNVTVLSVNHQHNFLDKLEQKKEFTDLENQLLQLEDKLKLENAHLDILREELAFLKENRNIGGKSQQVSVANLKEASNFYSAKLTSLKHKEIEINKNIYTLKEKKFEVEQQLKTLTSKKSFSSGEILVKVDSKSSSYANFEISYLVGNTGWLPSYDIRAKNINEPIEIVYKANVKQDTKVDWNNVKLKLSSADPNVSGVAPELRTYFLNYNTPPPSYGGTFNMVRGIVVDENNEALPGVNIIVKGTTIGAVTDFDGRYSITIPSILSELQYSYIGYETKTLQVSDEVMNVSLDTSADTLEEVVVVGYGSSKRKNLKIRGKASGVVTENATSIAIPLTQVENQTTVDFSIDIPYSIKSDNKSYAVNMVNYSLPADYNYYSVPKINKDAFLLANITDWEKYKLLEGEANIFFEGTYVGKSLLDVRYASDTLKISLGRDKNVIVQREKVKDFNSKKFIGTRKEEIRAWDISVKNNKSQKINITIIDQVPVSTLEEIKVETIDISRAKHNVENGELKWEFSLNPSEKKEIELKYSVKYPKNRNLIIE